MDTKQNQQQPGTTGTDQKADLGGQLQHGNEGGTENTGTGAVREGSGWNADEPNRDAMDQDRSNPGTEADNR